MKKPPTIIELPTTHAQQAHRAAWWRRRIIQLSPEQLSQRIGYSQEAIYLFERGVNSKGKPHKPKAWLRYKRACQGLHSEVLGKRTFEWGCS